MRIINYFIFSILLDKNKNNIISPYIVEYSDKSIAVFGNTFLIKNELKELGGHYNTKLTQNSTIIPGWIFSKKLIDDVKDIILLKKTKKSFYINYDKDIIPYIVKYSPFSYAVVGNTIPIKNQLQQIGGSYNRKLKINGEIMPGWLFLYKDKDSITYINEIISSIKLKSNQSIINDQNNECNEE